MGGVLSHRRFSLLGLQVLAAAAVVGSYELLSRADTDLLPRSLFPPPSSVAEAAYWEVQTHEFWRALLSTLTAWSYGLAVAVALAIPLGILLGSSRLGWQSVRLLADVLRPLPAIALLPLLLLVIGVNLNLTMFLVAYGAFWPLLIQTIYGVQDVEPLASDTARAYRFRWRERFLRIVLPTTLPYVATGLRIAAVLALNVTIAAEMIIAGRPGLGASIFLAQNNAEFSAMYVFVLMSGVLGLLINVVFRRLERRVLFWHPSQRAEIPA